MTSGAYRLTPWTEVARPHPDVAGGALDMGTYAANLAQVFRQAPGVPEVYARPERFFGATYFTEGLRRLLGDVLGVLAGGDGDRVLQLRTPFGGGKTHTPSCTSPAAARLRTRPNWPPCPKPGPSRWPYCPARSSTR